MEDEALEQALERMLDLEWADAGLDDPPPGPPGHPGGMAVELEGASNADADAERGDVGGSAAGSSAAADSGIAPHPLPGTPSD